MTDVSAAAGSATVIQPNAGIPAATTGDTTQGSTTVAADPFAGLVDPGIREWVGKAGFKDVTPASFGALAVKARDAESLIGRSIQLPGDDAKPEDWAKVYDRLGRPKDAAGYEFRALDGLPAEFAYDGEREKAFKADAHVAGLTPKQATQLRDAQVKRDAAAFTALQDKVKASTAAATVALEKAWGGPKDSEPYKASMSMAGRGLAGLEKLPGITGLQKALEGAGVLMTDGAGGSIIVEPTIAIALAEIGKRLFTEDGLVLGGTAVTGDNPFAGEGNMTLQMAMIRSDPSKARRMISALGKQPMDFLWDGKDVPALPR